MDTRSFFRIFARTGREVSKNSRNLHRTFCLVLDRRVCNIMFQHLLSCCCESFRGVLVGDKGVLHSLYTCV